MVISTECMVIQANTCLTAVNTVCGIAQLIGVNTNLNNTPYAVANVAALPTAVDNVGRFVYVSDIDSYRFSDGVSWTRNFVGSVPLANLVSWGSDSYGQLGDGTTNANQSSPVAAAGAYDQSWCTVASGWGNMIGVKTDGTLWTWGSNLCGLLGNGTTTNRSSPGTTIGGGNTWCQVDTAIRHSAAVKTDGTLWTWGRNTGGYLGDLTVVNRSSPGTTAGGGSNWQQVSLGRYHSTAIKDDGTLWTWGLNNCGQLGDGTTTARSSPGTTAGGGTNWCFVNTSLATTAAIKCDGTLWLWSSNELGALGNNSTLIQSSPVTTSGGGTTWCTASVGSGHSVAVKCDGSIWTWGWNSSGQLGDGTVTGRCSPGTTAGGGTNWCSVDAGGTVTGAVKTDGTLWMWGINNSGQLGDNSGLNRCSPTNPVGSICTWCSVAVGDNQTAGIFQFP